MLEEAQDLWRGAAYSEVRDEPFARAEARRLEEMLLAAIELRLDATFTLGRHEALIGELETLTSQHPMRERLWSQRMLALYRSGRQAEALRVFQDLRSTLVDELGIEPGHDVSWMEHAILSQDPALSFVVPVEPATGRDGRGGLAAARGGFLERVPRPHPHVTDPRSAGRARPGVGAAARMVGLGGQGRRAACSSSKATPALARHASSASWREPWRTRARSSCGVVATKNPVAPFQPFAEALGRYFHAMSADRISRMPNWQLAELSRLVLRLREFATPFEGDAGDPETKRFRFFEAVTETLSEISGNGEHPPGRRRPPLRGPGDPPPAPPRVAEHRPGQARHGRDVHRHRSAVGAPAAPGPRRSAVGPRRRDGAPGGPERRRCRGTGARLAEGTGRPCSAALQAD